MFKWSAISDVWFRTYFYHFILTFTWKPVKGSKAYSADHDQPPHHVASDHGLHCLITGFSIENRQNGPDNPNDRWIAVEDVQRTRTAIYFYWIMSLWKFHCGNRARSITLNPLRYFLENLVQIYSTIWQCAETKNCDSNYTIYRIMPLWKFHNGNRVR